MIDLSEPIPGDDPCGPDLQWDPELMALDQTMDGAVAENVDVVEGSRIADDETKFEDVVRMAEALCGRTKDLRVLCTLAEATWRDRGVAAFADVFAEMLAAVENWSDPETGIHPRADEDDGDLGLRAAPLAGLLLRVPVLANTVGWGRPGEPDQETRNTVAATLSSSFSQWDERFEPAFGPELPSELPAWRALSKYAVAGDVDDPEMAPAEDGAEPAATTGGKEPNYWELMERAAKQMERVTPHSPALTLLHIALSWRDKDLIAIAEAMQPSGITLEQLLSSAKQQLEPQ